MVFGTLKALSAVVIAASLVVLVVGAVNSVIAQESEKKVTLRLEALSTTVCKLPFPPLKMTIINDGQSDVSFNNLDIWVDFSVSFISTDGTRKHIGNLSIVPGRKEDYLKRQNEIVILKPDEKYTTTYNFPVIDDRVFYRFDKYSVSTLYKRAIESNSVDFEIEDCRTQSKQ